MPSPLLDHRMTDGSRNFADVDWVPPLLLRGKLEASPGVKVTAYIESPVEAWIDFEYAGHSFSLHNPLGPYWVFVQDPACSDEVLYQVVRFLA